MVKTEITILAMSSTQQVFVHSTSASFLAVYYILGPESHCCPGHGSAPILQREHQEMDAVSSSHFKYLYGFENSMGIQIPLVVSR